jgi:flavin reductase (DIM6/NTAB) family NADH-FMN oxidoreductase RutF
MAGRNTLMTGLIVGGDLFAMDRPSGVSAPISRSPVPEEICRRIEAAVADHQRDTIDIATTSWLETYRRLTEVVVPRPIALVATVDPKGVANLAPFSFFTIVSSNPPCVAFAPHRAGRTGSKKDTLRNIEQVGEFTVSVVTEEIAERVNSCAARLPYGDSEFEYSGLTPLAADQVKAPLVAESPVGLECTLEEIRTYGEAGGAGSLVVGRVVLMHLDPAVRDPADGRVVPERLRAVGRMGGSLWCRTRSTFLLERPS